MGGVEPDVGVPDVGRVTFLQVGDRVVERGAHPRHLAGAHAVYAHGLRHALHLAGGHAVGHHLGDRGGDRAVHARVTLDQALGEEAPRAQLRNPEVDVPDESIVLGLIGSVSTLWLLCQNAAIKAPKVTSPMNAWTIKLAMSITMSKVTGWSPA